MKKLLMIGILGMLAVSLAQAQTMQKSPEQRAAHFTKVLSRRLNLTADQAQQVNGFYLTQATRMDSLKANPSQNQRLNRLSARSISLSTRQHVMAVLNDTQKTQYEAWQKEMQQRERAKKDSVGGSQL